jgi:hypothetical protein
MERLKFDGEAVDKATMVQRRVRQLLRVREPDWRETLAFRVGFPVLGAVVGIAFAWLMIRL